MAEIMYTKPDDALSMANLVNQFKWGRGRGQNWVLRLVFPQLHTLAFNL
jgi:hypothetical protein